MKITILAVGKVKESWMRQGIDEYRKRLGKYCTLEIKEVDDEKTPENASDAEERKILQTEGERLLRQIKETDYVTALAIEGKNPDSVTFAHHLEKLALQGKSSLVFVIGGSLGLSDRVLKRADELLSFSRMTFPHQLMRVVFLEQLYRSFRISRNEPYHK